MPGAPVQDECVLRLEVECVQRTQVAGRGESSPRLGDDHESVIVQDHDRLGVREVAEEHLADQPAVHMRNLVREVGDNVQVHVVPGNSRRDWPSRGIGVSHRQPAEGRPSLLASGARPSGHESSDVIVVPLLLSWRCRRRCLQESLGRARIGDQQRWAGRAAWPPARVRPSSARLPRRRGWGWRRIDPGSGRSPGG